ncbi:putative membrane protein YesL [Pullulanibacillus pueri]|uniref:DUF624 domain-containing protein n=1 Tax=Pullulanibacillus pueri TaxID=1437324 RepID=A0A8J2ZZQ9_9BACL|nr:YesL family protein [Pullulanibacillus pueri]MBM7683512.1 putative membrane protein YesL [Pullulanibacillus pueri]GGH86955.1 hypothetical protein GCM10007096_35860 [Pullulanibacillus pueri]
MDTYGIWSGLYKAMDWIMKLAILNILWILFSLAGLIVFGFFPSTVAMFSVVRKWMIGNEEIPILKTFWTAYKREFLKSNLLGIAIILVGLVLLLDFLFLQRFHNGITSLLYIPFLIVTCLFVCMLFYMIPIFVHYEMKIPQVIKNSFFVVLMNPIPTFFMLLGSVFIILGLTFVPPISLLFSGNLLALLFMKPACNAFNKIYVKHRT